MFLVCLINICLDVHEVEQVVLILHYMEQVENNYVCLQSKPLFFSSVPIHKYLIFQRI